MRHKIKSRKLLPVSAAKPANFSRRLGYLLESCNRYLLGYPRAATFLPLVTDAGQTPRLAPGELLRIVRTTLRMTQEQLANRSGIVQAHIARMESGQVDAQWKTWEKLFEAMGCRLSGI